MTSDAERQGRSDLALARIAYDRALEAVERQGTRVEQIRNRSLGMLGAAFTISSLVLAQSGAELAEILEGGGAMALIMSAVMVVCAGYISYPHTMTLEDDASVILDDPAYLQMSEAEAISTLARHKADAWRRNQRVEDKLWTFLRVQYAVSVVVVLGWMWRVTQI